jgi:DNA-binding beta-propeller fold protein YncE
VYVTDRDNQRVQVFDADGRFLTQWPDIGVVSSLFLTADQRIWTGAVLRDLDGTVVGRLPAGRGAHGTTVTGSGDVYLAQLGGRVQKFTTH